MTSFHKNLLNSLCTLKKDTSRENPNQLWISNPEDEVQRTDLINKIENIMLQQVSLIMAGEGPNFQLPKLDWSTCQFTDKLMMDQSSERKVSVDFSSSTSRHKYTSMMFLLSKIHFLLLSGQTCTRRKMYYENIGYFNNQAQVDHIIKQISYLLNTPSWRLGLLVTSKGLMAGSVTMTWDNGVVVDCSTGGGVSIPNDISKIKNLETTAKWVLVVEKDTVFQKLLEEDALSRLGNCILITGKGYPDVNTRLITQRLSTELNLPVLILVDADPYGIEIMCVYRFGSLSMSFQASALCCPNLRWIGVHPSEVLPLGVQRVEMSKEDISRCKQLLHRPYVRQNEPIKLQIETLLSMKAKAEIEGVSKFSQAYLTDAYLPNKISNQQWI